MGYGLFKDLPKALLICGVCIAAIFVLIGIGIGLLL